MNQLSPELEIIFKNTDTITIKSDLGKFISINGNIFLRSEDESDSGVEYFQVNPESLEDEEKEGISEAVLPALGDIQKLFVVEVKDDEMQQTLDLQGKMFVIEDTSGGPDLWSVLYTSTEE